MPARGGLGMRLAALADLAARRLGGTMRPVRAVRAFLVRLAVGFGTAVLPVLLARAIVGTLDLDLVTLLGRHFTS
jgi:hypothetical protein